MSRGGYGRGGDGREGGKRQDDVPADADGDGDEDEGEGGSTWQQQSGYGERVLDPDKGDGAAQEEAERSEQMNEHGGA
jgi:hypothetical protein